MVGLAPASDICDRLGRGESTPVGVRVTADALPAQYPDAVPDPEPEPEEFPPLMRDEGMSAARREPKLGCSLALGTGGFSTTSQFVELTASATVGTIGPRMVSRSIGRGIRPSWIGGYTSSSLSSSSPSPSNSSNSIVAGTSSGELGGSTGRPLLGSIGHVPSLTHPALKILITNPSLNPLASLLEPVRLRWTFPTPPFHAIAGPSGRPDEVEEVREWEGVEAEEGVGEEANSVRRDSSRPTAEVGEGR